jgi:hypothetical protein
LRQSSNLPQSRLEVAELIDDKGHCLPPQRG